MPYIITKTWYPAHKIPETVKIFVESLRKYPADDSLGEQVVPNAVKSTELGITSLGITKVKEGKLEDALTRTQNVLIMFHGIEGFRYRIEVWATIEEAMAAIGQSMP